MSVNRPIAVFRADASRSIGYGHFIRCMSLARVLDEYGWECVFATRKTDEWRNISAINDKSFRLIVIDCVPENEAQAIAGEMQCAIDLLVVDSYDLDEVFEKSCRKYTDNIFVIDDLADRRHDCDSLLDQTLGRNASEYRGLVSPECLVLTGSSYALLRRQFQATRSVALRDRADRQGRIERVLVSFGGGASVSELLTSLEGLVMTGEPLEVDLVAASNDPALEVLQQAVARARHESFLRPAVHTDVSDMASLIAGADLAVGAGGTTTWERCCLGLPTLMVVTADNQMTVAEHVSRKGAVMALGSGYGFTAKDVAESFRYLKASPDKVRTMSVAASQVCDGRGGDRIVPALAGVGMAKDGRPVRLRFMTGDDEGTTFAWQQHSEIRKYFRNPQAPDREEHKRWMARVLDDPSVLPCIILHDGNPAGVVRLDHYKGDRVRADYEVSILIGPEKQGLGIGKKALHLIQRCRPAATLVAEVMPGNNNSRKLFLSAGYAPVDDSYYLLPPLNAERE